MPLTVFQPTEHSAGPSVRVVRVHRGRYDVISTPHPVHFASVSRVVGFPLWWVQVRTARVKPVMFPIDALETALRHAGTHVGTLYRLDMRNRFTGPQRYAMGQQLCPAHLSCLDVTCPDPRPVPHNHLCREPADLNTIWCPVHRRSPQATGGTG